MAMSTISVGTILSRESQLKSKIAQLKQEHAHLTEILGKKMQEAQCLSLVEKSQSLNEMITYQTKISEVMKCLTMLEESLLSIQREKEQKSQRFQCVNKESVQEVSQSSAAPQLNGMLNNFF